MQQDPSAWFLLAGVFIGGVLLGFIAGGEWRHRLWKSTDRYTSETTIGYLKTQATILQNHVATLQKHIAFLDKNGKEKT